MKALNINLLDITDKQKDTVRGWLQIFPAKKPISIRKDEFGNIYLTHYHDTWGRNITMKHSPCGYWLRDNVGISELESFELLHEFSVEHA